MFLYQTHCFPLLDKDLFLGLPSLYIGMLIDSIKSIVPIIGNSCNTATCLMVSKRFFAIF